MEMQPRPAYELVVEFRDRLKNIVRSPAFEKHPRVVVYKPMADDEFVWSAFPEPRFFQFWERNKINSGLEWILESVGINGVYFPDYNHVFLLSDVARSEEQFQRITAEEAAHSMVQIRMGEVDVTLSEISRFRPDLSDLPFTGEELADTLFDLYPGVGSYSFSMHEFAASIAGAYLLGKDFSSDYPDWNLFLENLKKIATDKQSRFIEIQLDHMPYVAAAMLVSSYGGDIRGLLEDHPVFNMDGPTIWNKYCKPLLTNWSLL